MSGSRKASSSIRHYFVDEAGDGVLFGEAGRVRVGMPGCSHYFILGVLDVADPQALADDLEELRSRLLSDPYFKNVPSMQPEQKKTALAFHAKDDVPEVRREVFSLLRGYEFRFMAVVRNKHKLLEYVRQRNERDPGYHYNQNELYDYMVRRLFKNLLHKEDQYNIYFAKRGNSDRTAALTEALHAAQLRFCQQWGIEVGAQLNPCAMAPAETPALQAADYFLWALQRLYERREERYVDLLRPSFSMVHDLDDTRRNLYGEYYTKGKPLTVAALEGLPGDIGSNSRS
jgi:hypothetical protein